MTNKVFDSLGIQQELNKVEGKAEKSYVDNNLSFINSSLEEKANKDYVDSTYAEKTDLYITNANVSKNTTDISTQSARIDALTSLPSGSTTGDAELIDARSVNGKTYTNIGGAIRALSSGDALGINIINTKHLDEDLQGLCDYIDLGLPLQQGYIEVGSNTVAENAGYQTLICTCEEGEKYSVDGYVVGTTKALVNFYSASGAYLNRLEKVDGATYKNYTFTVPSNVASFSVTSRSTGTGGFSPVIRKLKAYSVEKQKAYVNNRLDNAFNQNFPVFVKRYTYNSETYIKVMFHYASTLDMIILFKNCGQNGLIQIYNIYTCKRDGNFGDFTKTTTTIKTSYSDWIGPYKVLAVNNADGDNTSSTDFTGGWHGYNGDQTGSKTATLDSVYVVADGKDVNDGETTGCYNLKIIVTNKIQASNTKKNDGSGRNVLKETVIYSTCGYGKIDVSVKTEALEAVTIKEYYGIQVDNSGKYADNILYLNSVSKRLDFTQYNHIGTKGTDSPCRRFVGIGGTDYVTAYIDNEGLGSFDHVANGQGTAWNSSYKKSYFNLVKGVDLSLSAGQSTYFKGGYIFSKSTIIF